MGSTRNFATARHDSGDSFFGTIHLDVEIPEGTRDARGLGHDAAFGSSLNAKHPIKIHLAHVMDWTMCPTILPRVEVECGGAVGGHEFMPGDWAGSVWPGLR